MRLNRGGKRRAGATTLLIAFIVAAWLLPAGVPLAQAGSADRLSPKYREWLERDVSYIISKDERDAFLKLTSDETRDRFIDRFWEIRNTAPGAPTNPYKEEHYRRIAYANQYFGKESGTEGWRTDRGRIYITLGSPQQKAVYHGFQELRPMEIWFYSSSHPALPPFFYVAFYQRDIADDYRLYSPYFDGPEKLLTTMRGINDRVASFKIVDQVAGREVARTTLSLIPDEPVDIQNATGSLASDVMLGTIKNLANHPLTTGDLNRRRQILESVTYRLIYEGEFLNLLAVPLRDADGNINLHYVLRMKKPEDFAVGQADTDRYYYSIAVTARVHGADSKLIYEQEKNFSRYFNKKQLDQVKDKVFGYEGWLPLAPGKYKVEFLLTNLTKRTALKAEKEIVVPDVPREGLRLTEIVPFSEAETVDPARASWLPFAVASVKFTPLTLQDLFLVPGQDFKIFYQIWAPPNDPHAYRDKKLLVEYAYGRLGLRGDVKTIKDEVLKEQFDPAGSLVSGKKLQLVGAQAGNFLLTVSLTDPEKQQRASGSLGFRVSPNAAVPAVWDVYDDGIPEEVRKGVRDYQRGLCYLALGEKERAGQWFGRALEKNPSHEQARGKLVDLYFARQAFTEIAELFARAGITGDTGEQTILHTAESFDKLGNTQKAIQVLESALTVKPTSGPLYITLASYYQRMGNAQKAEELERKGKALLSSPSPTS